MNACEVFETKKKYTFAFVRKEQHLDNMPDATKKSLAPFRHFKRVDLDKALIAAESKKILEELDDNGFSIQSVEIRFTIR